MTERYGNAKVSTILKKQDTLRQLIRAQGDEEIQKAWDDLEGYVHSPVFIPAQTLRPVELLIDNRKIRAQMLAAMLCCAIGSIFAAMLLAAIQR